MGTLERLTAWFSDASTVSFIHSSSNLAKQLGTSWVHLSSAVDLMVGAQSSAHTPSGFASAITTLLPAASVPACPSTPEPSTWDQDAIMATPRAFRHRDASPLSRAILAPSSWPVPVSSVHVPSPRPAALKRSYAKVEMSKIAVEVSKWIGRNSFMHLGAFDTSFFDCHVLSLSGYPFHLTRYCICPRFLRELIICSTWYSSHPSISTGSGRGWCLCPE